MQFNNCCTHSAVCGIDGSPTASVGLLLQMIFVQNKTVQQQSAHNGGYELIETLDDLTPHLTQNCSTAVST